MTMLNKAVLQNIIDKLMSNGAEYAEVFCEDTIHNTIRMNDSEVNSSLSGRDFGASLRTFQNGRCYYAFTNDLRERSLLQLADQLVQAGRNCAITSDINLVEKQIINLHAATFVPSSIDAKSKAEIMHNITSGAKAYHPEVRQVSVVYRDIDQKVKIATSDGVSFSDRRIYTRALANVMASYNQAQESGQYEVFRLAGIECLHDAPPKEIGKQAASIAINNLHAKPCPSGILPVVIASGVGGTFLHEACGHALEAISVAYGKSYYSDRLGEKVASDIFTAYDSAILPNFAGSYNVDDEGIPGQKTLLIENGILKNYMIDRFHSRKMNMPATGNGRKQSYRYLPTSRMSNTYIAPSTDSKEDLFSDIDMGLYVTKIGGGNATPATSEFSFGVAEGFLIKNGEICHAVRGGTIIGKASEALLEVDRICDDLNYGFASCGASSGNVPVGDGAPSMRIRKLTVSGRTA